MKIYNIENYEYWYDRSQRCWFWAEWPSHLTPSKNAYTREEVEDAIRSEIKQDRLRKVCDK